MNAMLPCKHTPMRRRERILMRKTIIRKKQWCSYLMHGRCSVNGHWMGKNRGRERKCLNEQEGTNRQTRVFWDEYKVDDVPVSVWKGKRQKEKQKKYSFSFVGLFFFCGLVIGLCFCFGLLKIMSQLPAQFSPHFIIWLLKTIGILDNNKKRPLDFFYEKKIDIREDTPSCKDKENY